MTKTINFYSAGDPEYGYLSNFSSNPIFYNGVLYPTSEHLYQSMKFKDPDLQNKVRQAHSAKLSAQIGRTLSPIRKDWVEIKDYVMYNCLILKFTQHSNLRNKLIDTGSAILVEHTKNDKYWGDGGDGTGENKLGILLMKVRNELKKSDPF